MKKVYTVAVEDSRGIKDSLNIEALSEQEACDLAIELAQETFCMCEPVEVIASFEGISIDFSLDEDYRLFITRTDIGHLKIEERKQYENNC